MRFAFTSRIKGEGSLRASEAVRSKLLYVCVHSTKIESWRIEMDIILLQNEREFTLKLIKFYIHLNLFRSLRASIHTYTLF